MRKKISLGHNFGGLSKNKSYKKRTKALVCHKKIEDFDVHVTQAIKSQETLC